MVHGEKLRGKTLNITVHNPNGSQHGVKSVSVNGVTLEGISICRRSMG